MKQFTKDRKVALIGAISTNGVYGIGRAEKGKIPWSVPLDMKFFTQMTTGDGNNAVIMSRGMWDALPDKYRPLKDRRNIIVTSNQELVNGPPQGAIAALSPLQAFQCVGDHQDVFFAGGQDMWYGAQDLIDVLYINVIHQEKQGEDLICFHHLLDPTKLWPEFEHIETRYETCTKSGVMVAFCEYRRKE
jgi:dihydrofolate reductase